MTDADPLTGYLHSAVGRAFEFGRFDCALFCADWVLHVKHRDPAAAWRGHYNSEHGAARLQVRHGGIVALFDAGLLAIGCKRTDKPQRGDIAVMESAEGLAGGIVLGTVIAALHAERGLVIRHLSHTWIAASWRI